MKGSRHRGGGAAPFYVPAIRMVGYGFTGEAVRSRRQPMRLTSPCRVAPRLIAYPEEYPEANRGWTSHDKVERGKKCEVGEPVRMVS